MNRREHSLRCSSEAASGQALILAVIVMLLLIFLSTIFLRTVLNNLGQARHVVSSSNEYLAAQAGIRFADTQLTTSELGADWRPRPSININRLLGTGNQALLQTDPDWRWIQPFDPASQLGGYVRYNLGDARYLLRVTYNPRNSTAAPLMPDVDTSDPNRLVNGEWGPTPLSRFIMIEAIGRRGSAAEIDKEYQDFIRNGDPIDPTVFTQGSITAGGSAVSLFRRELIAFKAIGINNYLRFVTDRDRLGRPTYLGVDQGLLTDGNISGPLNIDMPFRFGVDARAFGPELKAQATGSPIRVNGDLVLYGTQTPAVDQGSEQPELVISLTSEPFNVIEVEGTITRQGAGQDQPDANRMALHLYPPSGDANAQVSTAAIPASNEPDFQRLLSDPAFAGRVTDGVWLKADPSQKQNLDPRRSVRRLEPPSIEAIDPASGLPRFEVMTARAGAVRTDPPWRGIAAARYGFGAGIYIDNARHSRDHGWCRGDIQFGHDPEMLRNDWLRPYSQVAQGTSTGWVAPGRIYNPVGVLITIEPDWTNPGAPLTHGLIGITRTDPFGWRDPAGNRLSAQTVYFELQPAGTPAPGNDQEYSLLPKWWDGNTWQTWDWTTNRAEPLTANATRYPFNGVIYAEGNIRIRGRLPQDTEYGGARLTVVSRGTIYIEGNVMKGAPRDAQTPGRSQIALLARDYVSLNTTALVQVQTDFLPVAGGDNGRPFHWRLPVNEPERTFTISWDFGVSPIDSRVSDYYQWAAQGPLDNHVALFLRHQADRAPATIQCLVNNVPYLFTLTGNGFGGSPQGFYPLRNAGVWEYFKADLPAPPHPFDIYPLPNNPPQSYEIAVAPGQRNVIRIQSYDPGTAPDGTNLTGGDYNLAAAAVQPLDVMITALIYAEHQSWFVIPGAFFQDLESGDVEPAAQWRYPRNKEPLDVQIHVLGAIAEGRAASIEDVTLWTAHWRGANRTPFEAGASDPVAENADYTFGKRGGINYGFDPQLITETRQVRYSPDEPVYFLPGLPRLPTCPDLVYFGERPLK